MLQIDILKKRFKNNNFDFTYLESKEELLPLLDSLMPEGSSVSVGGSVTLTQTGVLDYLRSGRFNFLDRYAENADVQKIFRECYYADFYLASANAITEHGEVYMVDGTGNRVSATIFGPKHVLLVCGRNKIVENLSKAIERVKTIAAPLNAKRLNCGTYCRDNGRCGSCECDERHLMTRFTCERTICSSSIILSRQIIKDRIHIILINEDLGY